MSKVLMGIPYYGRDWTAAKPSSAAAAPSYSRQSRGLFTSGGSSDPKDLGMMEVIAKVGAAIKRDASLIPYFTYTDANGPHTAYFDDAQSWTRKLELLEEYGLGGVGAWSLYWTLNPAIANELYPLLKQYLR